MENTLIFIFQVEKHNVKKNLGEYTTILDPNYFLEYIIRILSIFDIIKISKKTATFVN
jgi:hypothetical protein